jgi:predicted TIM-barrel fold metal-dependent hydrolase
MDLIDTHQHLIHRDRLGYGWTAGIPALARGDFTVADYRALTKGLGIVGTVFMESAVDDADYQEEARLVAALVGREGMLGQIASCRPETDEGFDAWLNEGAALHVKGYRRVLHVMPDELSQSETFRANLRKIGARGLPFDLCVLPRQLPLAEALARACDGMSLVLDHCGVPDIEGGAFEPWAQGIDALARLPHVHCKISGLTAYAGPGATAATLRPWVDHVLNRFGPDRCLWGGDWPVVNLGAGLPEWIAMTRELLASLSAEERARVGTGTARAVYRI